MARVLGMSRRTIDTGIRELEPLREDDPDHPQRPSGDAKRVRRPGGGRPPITDRKPQLESTLHEVLEVHSAGSPTDERVRWTDLKPLQLAHHLLERGFEISRNTAAVLLDRAGFRRRALRRGQCRALAARDRAHPRCDLRDRPHVLRHLPRRQGSVHSP